MAKAIIARHTSYFLVDEKGNLEMVSYAPDQDYTGRRDSDHLAMVTGLFIDNISHDLWLGDVVCHRVVMAPSGLHTNEGLKYRIVAKKTFLWDMSKPVGHRQSDLKKSLKWDQCLDFQCRKIKWL